MWNNFLNPSIGLLAGEGNYPFVVAQALAAKKKRLTVFGIEGCFDKRIGEFAERIVLVKLGAVDELVKLLKDHKIKQLVLAGAVPKKEMFNSSFQMDDSAKNIIQKTSNRGDDHLLRAFQVFLKVKCGISIMDARKFLKDSLCRKGILTQRTPSPEEKKDLEFGWKIAKGIGKMDIGQTVVVKHGVVLAVEALEGTNSAILRGGELGQGEAVVIKRTKPNQNLRYDLPCVGLETLETLRTASSKVLGLEARKTLLISKNELIQKADEYGLTIVGL